LNQIAYQFVHLTYTHTHEHCSIFYCCCWFDTVIEEEEQEKGDGKGREKTHSYWCVFNAHTQIR